MSTLEKIRAYLSDRPMSVFCDDCLSKLLKIEPRQTIQQKTSALGKTFPFQRRSGRCSLCKSTKLVIGCVGLQNASKPVADSAPAVPEQPTVFSEDEVKKALENRLSAQGWSLEIKWAKQQGIDIHAKRDSERWIIEVKGGGSLQPMRVNYFLGVLGETLQRMDDPNAKYSIALPNLRPFRNLWERLPVLARQRTQISALFVSRDGLVEQVL